MTRKYDLSHRPRHELQSPKISIVIVSYNHKDYLGPCLDSLLSQTYSNYEIIVVDNNSSDGSADYVQTTYPLIKVIKSKQNLGFAGGNNLGVQQASGEYLAFINPDTTVDPQWLEALLKPFKHMPQIGMTTAKILLMKYPSHINTCGNDVHYTGIGFLRGSNRPSSEFNSQEEVVAISGAAFLMPKLLYQAIEGFDENFAPAYVEDTDLSWRVILMGRKCLFVPDAIVYHDYQPNFSANKYFMIEKNRWQLLLKHYRLPTLLLLLPALLLAEIISWGFCFTSGRQYIVAKLRSYYWIMSHFRTISQKRKKLQSTRKVKDRTLLRKCVAYLAYSQASSSLAGKIAPFVFNPLFFILHKLYLILIWW